MPGTCAKSKRATCWGQKNVAFQPGTEGDSLGAQVLCKSKRATCQKPAKRDWASGSTCFGSERRVRVRLEIGLNYGLESGTERDSLGAQHLCQIKESNLSEASQ